MDINALTTLIGSLGFPIVMCIIIFLQMQKNEEAHKEEIKQLTEAVQRTRNDERFQKIYIIGRKAS